MSNPANISGLFFFGGYPIKKKTLGVENLKSCGNCANFCNDCAVWSDHMDLSVNHYCDKWQSDGMNRSDRVII